MQSKNKVLTQSQLKQVVGGNGGGGGGVEPPQILARYSYAENGGGGDGIEPPKKP